MPALLVYKPGFGIRIIFGVETFFTFSCKKVKLLFIKGKNAYICKMKAIEQETLKEIPSRIDNNEILILVNESPAKQRAYFIGLKNFTRADDKEISHWLGIGEKTYRSYKTVNKPFKPSLFEHSIMLISLFKHGSEIFGNSEQFKQWLKKENFYFDGKTPDSFMNTISGIKFIDDRLTGMEYGDNA
jgi:uncharacterized protein (DUF2384 family)